MSPGSTCEKEEKGRNLIVDVLITEQSSQALGFSLPQWSDHIFCVCVKGTKKGGVEVTF